MYTQIIVSWCRYVGVYVEWELKQSSSSGVQGQPRVICGVTRTFHGRSSSEARGTLNQRRLFVWRFHLQKPRRVLLAKGVPSKLECRNSGVR